MFKLFLLLKDVQYFHHLKKNKKTLNLEKISDFSISSQVKDIHAILEVTLYDEDRDKKYEFLGKVAIPLLKVRT